MNEICRECILRRNLNKWPEGSPPEQTAEYQKKVTAWMDNSPADATGPEAVAYIKKLREEIFHEQEKDYSEIKRYFNALMMSKEPQLREKLRKAEDPLLFALQIAMTGNFIDFAAMNSVDEKQLERFLEEADKVRLSAEVTGQLRADLDRGRTLTYLTDNCGEIVMDKLLIGEIMRQFPRLEVTVIVRGKPVVNDATMEDAEQTGLTRMTRVIGNGSDINGTLLKKVSGEAYRAVTEADVVLAKGQGNYETLNGCGRPVYYLFMCKCAYFTNRFGVKLYEGVLARE